MEMNRISEDDCLKAITKPLFKGEGFRHLWVAYTGWGKSVANSILAKYLANFSNSNTIVVDQKNKNCVYPGTQIVSLNQLKDTKDNQVIIRGAAMSRNHRDIVKFDDVAADVWAIGQSTDTLITLMPDELTDAASGQTWISPLLERQYFSESQKKLVIEKYRDPWMEKLYRQGRVLGISISAATQFIAEAPRTALASDTLGVFRQRGRELAYLQRLGYLDKESSEIVKNLNVGEFLLIQQGQDSAVCKFEYDGG